MRAIESALAQNFPAAAYEIIIVNDGSEDKTAAIIDSYVDRTNIRVIHQKNQGAIEAANVGFKAARGACVAPLDSDDEYSPRFLAETVALLEKNRNLDFVYTDYVEEFNGAERICELNDLFQTIVDNTVYRKASLEKEGFWRDEVFFAEYDLLLRTLSRWHHAHIAQALVTYHRRIKSLTGNADRVNKALDQLRQLHPDKAHEITSIRSYTLPSLI